MSFFPKIGNRLWKLSCARRMRAFSRSMHKPVRTQTEYLMRLMRLNQSTLFGRMYHFSTIDSTETFRANVPLTSYEDYLPFIEMIAHGRESVLTNEEILLFEPSSGSSSARKLIPYTRSLQKEFQNAISPWIMSVFRNHPLTLNGRSYWSISPSLHRDNLYGCKKVGFDSDSSYLGTLGKFLFSKIAVVPHIGKTSTDNESFRKNTITSLLLARDLSLVSVWNPTFLTLLLEYYLEDQQNILNNIKVLNRKRAAELESIGLEKDLFERIWPNLALISCWEDGPSQKPAKHLKSFFPNITIQGKGLLSTEACVSIPFLPDQDPLLAVNSHFYEFISEDGTALLPHETIAGQEYSIAVTTGGGLYRYRLYDKVRLTGFIGSVPTIRFIGKEDLISDLFGEKIHAGHIESLIADMFADSDYSFAMVAPDTSNNGSGYTLYIETEDIPSDAVTAFESKLKENPHYTYCRELGQLRPFRIFRITGNGQKQYVQHLTSEGMKAGDIKSKILSSREDWSSVFTGYYIENIPIRI